MILIGSKAIKHWFPDFPREPKDTDYIVHEYKKYDEFPEINQPKDGTKIEYLKNKVISDLYKNADKMVLPPDQLYTLKMSHLFWDINWEKHEWDASWLRNKGCNLDYPLFHKLYKFHNDLHGKNKRSDLKMSASEFFNNALDCEYDHDWLHTLLKPYPTFNKVLKDGEEVEVDYNKFHMLAELEKEELVREEVEIMAFERWPKLDYRFAYGRMLKKFILSHAPIWEAIWILGNYPKLCKVRHNFIKILNEKINEQGINIIRRPSGSFKKQVPV